MKSTENAATSEEETTICQENTPNSQAGSRLDASWIQAGSRLDSDWLQAGSRLDASCIQAGYRLDSDSNGPR